MRKMKSFDSNSTSTQQISLSLSTVLFDTTNENASTSSSESSLVSFSSIIISYPVTVSPLFGGDGIIYDVNAMTPTNILFSPNRVMLPPRSWPSLCGPMPHSMKRQIQRHQSLSGSLKSNDTHRYNGRYQLPIALLLLSEELTKSKTECSLTEVMNNVIQINTEMYIASTAAAVVTPITMLILPNNLLYDNNTYSVFDIDTQRNSTSPTIVTFVFLDINDIQKIVTDVHNSIKRNSVQKPLLGDNEDDDDNHQLTTQSSKSTLQNAHFGGKNSMDFMYSMALTADIDHDRSITIDDYILFSTRHDSTTSIAPTVTTAPDDGSWIGSVPLSPSPTLILSGTTPTNVSPSHATSVAAGISTTSTNWLAIYISIFWIIIFCCLLRTHLVTLRLLREAQKINRLILHPNDEVNEYDVRSASTDSTADTRAEVWSRASL
jgi:hypothetical protein